MCMIDEMNNRIKDLEQMIREKDIALMGLQAKNQGLQARLSVSEREKSMLNDQAKTLHLVAHQLGAQAGEEVIKAVPMAVRQLIAERERLLDGVTSEREHITTHATHAARCQLIQELAEAYDSDNQVTIEQVVDRLSGEPRKGGRQC